MEQGFSDRRVLITGASKGLGKAAAVAFEQRGARLALVARSEDKLQELGNSFADQNRHCLFSLDLLHSKNIVEMTSSIIKRWSGVDVILHCIGGSLGVNQTLVDWEEFSKSLKGNVGIASEINRHLVPHMKEQGFGNIIHVSSIAGAEARASVPYNTAKASISGYVRSLGKELAEYGIVVSGILPGTFYGDDNAMARYAYYKPEEYQEFVKTLPQGRMPQAEEYVPILCLLANTESQIMSGSLISLDGAQGQAFFNFAS